MKTILDEYKVVHNLYYEDYLKYINKYKNITRQGIFIKYYNINMNESIYEQKNKSTLNIYSQSKFDIYDFTPVYNISPVNNRSSSVMDLSGQMMDGVTSISLFTIDYPRINDIMSFYLPTLSNEIFKVTNVSTSISMSLSTQKLFIYELEMEYAPVININDLNINNNYVYDLLSQQNIKHSDYTNKLNILNKVSKVFEKLHKYYNSNTDLYMADNKIVCETNELMIKKKKKYDNNYYRILTKYKSPYSYLDIIKTKLYNTLDSFPFKDLNNNLYYIVDYNSINKELQEYNWNDKNNIHNDIEDLLSISLELYNILVEDNPNGI